MTFQKLKLDDLPQHYPCRALTRIAGKDRLISGGYACDLLSWVISRAGSNDVWFTILNSINVVAVASLADCACVMLTENVGMAPEVLKIAEEKGVTILATELPTWAASVRLANLLHQKS